MSKFKKAILDSSALIALLEKEKGWEEMNGVINNSIMSSVNVSEVSKFLIDRRGYKRHEAKDIMEHLLDEIIDFTAEHAYIAAELYPKTKALGLSLGDRACLTLSLVTGYPIYTADQAWTKLNIAKIHIKVIR